MKLFKNTKPGIKLFHQLADHKMLSAKVHCISRSKDKEVYFCIDKNHQHIFNVTVKINDLDKDIRQNLTVMRLINSNTTTDVKHIVSKRSENFPSTIIYR